ncbi:MAG: hypothetical protein RI885_2494 [Actinomycetota bacterium]|jgi:hypothetical protein
MTDHSHLDPRSDDGSTLILTIFYALLALVLVLLVVAATSLYLERKRLFTLADGAALAGAEGFELDDVRPSASGFRPLLDDDAVRSATVDYLGSASGQRFEALELERAYSADGVSATVTLSSSWRPPVLTVFVPAGLRLEAMANARSVFG